MVRGYIYEKKQRVGGKRLVQTFSLRFNIIVGRKGHMWGERYESDILWEGPPEGTEEVDWAAVEMSAKTKIPAAIACTLSWDSPRSDGMTITTRFSAHNAAKPMSPPGSPSALRPKRGYRQPRASWPKVAAGEVCPHRNIGF
ncbi:MAG: hypothetical protein LBG27_02370 [Spirochaetaceae bacterium]|nr:hypothetical protein [Spirochaetaceae bacterium]